MQVGARDVGNRSRHLGDRGHVLAEHREEYALGSSQAKQILKSVGQTLTTGSQEGWPLVDHHKSRRRTVGPAPYGVVQLDPDQARHEPANVGRPLGWRKVDEGDAVIKELGEVDAVRAAAQSKPYRPEPEQAVSAA